MTKEQIEKILQNEPINHEETDDSNGVGLYNVLSRLRIYFRVTDVVNIISDGLDQGTEMIVTLPKPIDGGNDV